MSEFIRLTRDDKVATVTLARPPLNLITRPMMYELRSVFDGLAEDRSVNSVVLSAEGDTMFCAGLDLKVRLQQIDEEGGAYGDESSVAALLDSTKPWREAQWAVRRCPVPVIAAVDGGAVGGGFGLVAVCDIVFASERAWFSLNEINVGVLGGASKALRMFGPYKARSMFFTGDRVHADELHRRGSIEDLTKPGEALAKATEMARRLAEKSPIGLRLAKESILRIEDMPLEDAYRMENDYSLRLATYDDSREAMAAWIEKRPPRWTWS